MSFTGFQRQRNELPQSPHKHTISNSTAVRFPRSARISYFSPLHQTIASSFLCLLLCHYIVTKSHLLMYFFFFVTCHVCFDLLNDAWVSFLIRPYEASCSLTETSHDCSRPFTSKYSSRLNSNEATHARYVCPATNDGG